MPANVQRPNGRISAKVRNSLVKIALVAIEAADVERRVCSPMSSTALRTLKALEESHLMESDLKDAKEELHRKANEDRLKLREKS